MIIGIGTDIVEIARIKKVIERYGNAFIHRVFTPAEIALAKERQNRAEFYAGRWAAKEAAAKALGCGFGAECSHTDIETLTGADGVPILKCHVACSKIKQHSGSHHPLIWHISITHERSCAAAMVILEKQ
jgi:holo-[acyl-carrier protein] synthase